MNELPIIQKTYDLIKWYVPHLNRLPRQHKFSLGDRISSGLYDLLESLIKARYSSDKVAQLNAINIQLEILRYQTRLLYDFDLMDVRRWEFVSNIFNEIGKDLGGWIKFQGV
jgi:23S rRNA-intervening sequence protein